MPEVIELSSNTLVNSCPTPASRYIASLRFALACATVVSVENVILSAVATLELAFPPVFPPAKYPFVDPSETPAKQNLA